MAIKSKIIYKNDIPYRVTLEVTNISGLTFENKSNLSDTEAKKIMDKLMPKFKAELKDYIKSNYNEWFDMPLNQAINLGEELIDYFEIKNHKDGNYYVEIMANCYQDHKDCDKFFDGNFIYCIYIVNKYGGIIKKHNMKLEG